MITKKKSSQNSLSENGKVNDLNVKIIELEEANRQTEKQAKKEFRQAKKQAKEEEKEFREKYKDYEPYELTEI
jgi:hypothetical protein